jgi:hypothetical protein
VNTYKGPIAALFGTAAEFKTIAKVFTLRGFENLWRHLKFVDNTYAPERGSAEARANRLFKVQWLLDAFRTRCRTVWKAGRFLTLDEMMIAFRGRSYLKMYMPLKPIKRGFKVFAVCCARTKLLVNFEVYGETLGAAANRWEADLAAAAAADTAAATDDAAAADTTATEEPEDRQPATEQEAVEAYTLVMRLMLLFQSKFHVVVMDRYFTGRDLFMKLLEIKVYAVGTAISTRLAPCMFRKLAKDALRGFTEVKQMGDKMIGVLWKDTKVVHFLSTFGNSAERYDTHRRTRDPADKKFKPMPVPSTFVEKMYAKFMNGVDMFDQVSAALRIKLRSSRWYIPIANWVFLSAVSAAYLLYLGSAAAKAHIAGSRRAFTQREFVQHIIESLIGTYSERKKPDAYGRVVVPAVLNASDHDRRSFPQSSCAQCGARTRSVCQCPIHTLHFSLRFRCCARAYVICTTRYSQGCRGCGVRLCKPGDCWKKWHKKKESETKTALGHANSALKATVKAMKASLKAALTPQSDASRVRRRDETDEIDEEEAQRRSPPRSPTGGAMLQNPLRQLAAAAIGVSDAAGPSSAQLSPPL